jgi:hypothetical protein
MKTRIRSVLVALALICLAAAGPNAQALIPPPDGGYPGGNTAEGQAALLSRTTGGFNTAVGWFSLKSLTTGSFNTGVGAGTLVLNTGDENTATGVGALLLNTTGGQNTATGALALFNNTEGSGNTANGVQALFSNTTGSGNTAIGVEALKDNTDGVDNTATGFGALMSNTGVDNTANGSVALQSNTTGEANTAVGSQALFSNTEGGGNTAVGASALFGNMGNFNTAIGDEALLSNTTGENNTAIGTAALFNNTIGNFNTATGYQALLTNVGGQSNTAYGAGALLNNTGTGNIALGANAGLHLTTGFDNIDIGNTGAIADDSTIRIGSGAAATFISGIFGVPIAGTPVVVINNGQLGVAPSSARFKNEIKPMDKASEAILALKPVTFCYKKELDPNGIPQFGLVAEDVAKVNPALVARDARGELYTVRYEAVNAMLLNEFLKEHRKVEQQERELRRQKALIGCLNSTAEKQEANAAQQQKEIQALTVSLKEQACQIQKVSARIEMSNHAARVVVNNP